MWPYTHTTQPANKWDMLSKVVGYNYFLLPVTFTMMIEISYSRYNGPASMS
jgi:hypothetical protein